MPYTSEEAQPNNHPMIDVKARGEWLIMMLIVDEVGEMLQRDEIVEMMEEWVEGVNAKGDAELSYGAWDMEVIMS